MSLVVEHSLSREENYNLWSIKLRHLYSHKLFEYTLNMNREQRIVGFLFICIAGLGSYVLIQTIVIIIGSIEGF